MISHGLILFGFHILLLMMTWSLLVTMNTHPGEIPLYWVNLFIIDYIGVLHRR